jgi:ABC-type transport system involved in multi-copper enzyme maturation permease subunit
MAIGMKQFGLGPVFKLEWLRASRRWQFYALRALFILGLLGAVAAVFIVERNTPHPPNISAIQEQAAIGEKLFYLLTGVQITLLLLAAPAATAGSLCIDKALGALVHLLVTDLSSSEIVLGKLAARLGPVLGLVGSSVPVLFLCTWFGGIDPEALIGAYLVSIGVAVLGCTLALTLSVWGKRTHEVLLVVYMAWLLALLAAPILGSVGSFFKLWVSLPTWVGELNPYWVTYAPYWNPGTTTWREPVGFLAGCVIISSLLVLLATSRIRAVTVRQSGSYTKARSRRGLRVGLPRLPGPRLDRNPIAWREWHRNRVRGWIGAVLFLYAFMACLFTLISGLQSLATPGPRGATMGIFTNALQVTVGMLFVSVGAVTALAEERVRGSLDAILTTPLSTFEIVWGKWWGSYRPVPMLTLLPTILAVVLAQQDYTWECAVLLAGVILAHGAFLTSLGLAIATGVARFGRAVTLAVVLYVLQTVGFMLVFVLFKGAGPEDSALFLGFGSPGFAAMMLSILTIERPSYFNYVAWGLVWIAMIWVAAGLIFLATLRRFNALMGRVSGRDDCVRSSRISTLAQASPNQRPPL